MELFYLPQGRMYTGTVVASPASDPELWVRLIDRPSTTVFFPPDSPRSPSQYELLTPGWPVEPAAAAAVEGAES